MESAPLRPPQVSNVTVPFGNDIMKFIILIGMDARTPDQYARNAYQSEDKIGSRLLDRENFQPNQQEQQAVQNLVDQLPERPILLRLFGHSQVSSVIAEEQPSDDHGDRP